MAYFIGIDSSTTATKALLLDDEGNVVAVASGEYPFDTPRPLWSEQSPRLWWDATVMSIRALLKKSGVKGDDVKGIGLTGQMHGLVLLDKNGEVLRPAILWNDQRTGTQCNKIHEIVGKQNFIQVTGNVALTGFTAPKILWVRENEPEIYAQARQILLPKDYIRYKLTNIYAMDRAGGAGTALFNLKERSWSTEILKKLDIDPTLLPPTFEGTDITGEISSEAARLTGLKEGTPVVGGGGDQAAGAVGVGAVRPGVVGLVLGTSGVVFATTPSALVEPEGRLHAFCHSVPGRWHFMGVMLSAAGSLRWYRDTLASGMDYDELLAPAADIPAGSDGLQFLPYLTGERTPHPDPLARGAFVGLTIRHRKEHMTRAVLEGVAFGLRDSFELIKAAGLPDIEQVRVSGGGAKSSLWRQILADTLNAELVTVNTTEGAAYGAALMAGVGAGAWPDVDSACDECIKVTGLTAVQQHRVQIYDSSYQAYTKLYPALKPSWSAL
jgi:xylulokinase